MGRGQVAGVAQGTVDDDVEVRPRLAVGPGRIVVGAVGEDGHRPAAGRRGVIDVAMDLVEVVTDGAKTAARCRRFVRLDERSGPQRVDMAEAALIAVDPGDQVGAGGVVAPQAKIDGQDESGRGVV